MDSVEYQTVKKKESRSKKHQKITFLVQKIAIQALNRTTSTIIYLTYTPSQLNLLQIFTSYSFLTSPITTRTKTMTDS